MEPDKSLPTIHDLHNIANSARFPATPDEIVESARRAGLPHNAIDFLNLFSADLIFDSKVDFLTRCEDLEILIEQEADAPKEISRGP
jgi:hypothetical protein